MKVVVFLALLGSSSYACAADIASCSEPTGKGYYPEIGIVKKEDAGWEDEAITGGITKLVRNSDGSYDILFVDARKEIISAVQDGAFIVMLNQGENAASFLVVYPGKTAKVFGHAW